MIANDPYAELERRFARHERRQSRRRDPELGSLDHDAGRRERGSRRPARDPGRDRPRDDGRRPTCPSCWRARRRAARASIRGAPPTCARCATSWVHESALPSDLVEARTRAIVGLRDGVARGQEERRLQVAAADAHRGADHHAPGRRGQGRGARHVALRRAARRVRAGRPLPRASTRCSPSCEAFLPDLLRPRHGAPEARACAACRSTARSRSRRSASWARS